MLGAEAQAVPCLATIKLAMQSGTLVPAARKVMPMMTSGMPSVYPMIVTCRRGQSQGSKSTETVMADGPGNSLPCVLLQFIFEDFFFFGGGSYITQAGLELAMEPRVALNSESSCFHPPPKMMELQACSPMPGLCGAED